MDLHSILLQSVRVTGYNYDMGRISYIISHKLDNSFNNIHNIYSNMLCIQEHSYIERIYTPHTRSTMITCVGVHSSVQVRAHAHPCAGPSKKDINALSTYALTTLFLPWYLVTR